MKRATNIVLVMVVLVVLFAGAAVAQTFTCKKVDCEGTSKDDVITGTSLSQTFNAKAGNDQVMARGGGDTVNGQTGDDRLIGEGGCDTLDGGQGVDILNNALNDNCNAGETANAVDGAPNDRIVTNDNRPDDIQCDTGDRFRADAGTDSVNGTPVPGTTNTDVSGTC